MASLRQRLFKIQQLPKSNNNKYDEFNDLKEMMDEIQEALDTSDETEEGLKGLGDTKTSQFTFSSGFAMQVQVASTPVS